MKASAISTSTSSVGILRVVAVLTLIVLALSLPFMISGPGYEHPETDLIGP